MRAYLDPSTALYCGKCGCLLAHVGRAGNLGIFNAECINSACSELNKVKRYPRPFVEEVGETPQAST